VKSCSVILVTGGTGAGKTTHARALAEEIGGVRFSIDDWTTELFWMDAPDPPDFDWIMTRIGRCETRIRAVAKDILLRGVPVVLDLGFTKSAHRRVFIDWAKDLGHAVRIDHVDVPTQTRWSRVQSRNAEQGETYAMTVTREMFDFMENEWEAPQSDEADIRVV
jgi:predicted kinase